MVDISGRVASGYPSDDLHGRLPSQPSEAVRPAHRRLRLRALKRCVPGAIAGRLAPVLMLLLSLLLPGQGIVAAAFPIVSPQSAAGLTGGTYDQWSAAWTQYVFSVPASVNPLTDLTGVDCAVDQSSSSPVFFLTGLSGLFTSQSSADRTCSVPAGKYLFFPVYNAWVDNLGNAPAMSTSQMLQLAAAIVDSGSGFYASIDGVPVGDLSGYRAQAAFSRSMPASGNLYNLIGYGCSATNPSQCAGPDGQPVPWQGLSYNPASNTLSAVSTDNGYYLMLAPLSPGSHTIQFGATGMAITYHLTVPAQ